MRVEILSSSSSGHAGARRFCTACSYLELMEAEGRIGSDALPPACLALLSSHNRRIKPVDGFERADRESSKEREKAGQASAK